MLGRTTLKKSLNTAQCATIPSFSGPQTQGDSFRGKQELWGLVLAKKSRFKSLSLSRGVGAAAFGDSLDVLSQLGQSQLLPAGWWQ